MAAAFGRPRNERVAQALANQANAKPRSAAWAAGIVEGVYTDLEAQVEDR